MKKRFQKATFKTQLKTARNYSRSKDQANAFLKVFKVLGSKWTWLAIITIALASYVVYFPSYFSIYSLDILSPDVTLTAKVDVAASNYLRSFTKWGLPKGNSLFFNRDDFNQKLQEELAQVLRVETEKNGIAGRLRLVVVERLESFSLSSGNLTTKLSQDGKVLGQATKADPALPVLAVLLPKTPTGTGSRREELFDEERNALIYLREHLTLETKLPFPNLVTFLPVTVTEAKPKPALEGSPAKNPGLVPTAETRVLDEPSLEMKVTVPFGTSISQSPLEILLPVKSDLSNEFARLKALIDKKGLEKVKLLAYIDLRYEDKAFLCEVGAPCAKNPSEPLPAQPEVNQ
jgi:hypothetical protein